LDLVVEEVETLAAIDRQERFLIAIPALLGSGVETGIITNVDGWSQVSQIIFAPHAMCFGSLFKLSWLLT
jgi:hypothetical protein